MSKTQLSLVAVGNALVDVIAQVSDGFVKQQEQQYGLTKGTMTLIDQERAVELYVQMGSDTETSGGSAANTMAGFASFGGKGGFIGKVAEDELGETFQKELLSQNIHFDTPPLTTGAHTGRCLILVSPDAQRTMNTFLGASVELCSEDVDEALISNADIVYLEGYLFDKEHAKQAFIRASEIAHKHNTQTALTLSDPFCVDRHREDFLNLVEEHIDILFANEEEIKSLYQTDSFEEAKALIQGKCDIAALTRSEKGCVIITKDGQEIVQPAHPVEKVIDTTGAGDQFAAGFLYGLTEKLALKDCAKLGTLAASEVISHIGPRPLVSLAELRTKAA